MTSPSITISSEAGDHDHLSIFPAIANLPISNENPSEDEEIEDEDGEEDVDFNPFLKESLSLEASSSLSSEIEGLDTDVAESADNTCADLSELHDEVQDYAVGDCEHGEEIVMQTIVSSRGICRIGSKKTSTLTPKETESNFLSNSQKSSPFNMKERKSNIPSKPENESFCGKDNGSSSRADVVNDVTIGESNNTARCRKSDMAIDDAICMRTRARYSLASFTLDELETFLQETDDDDDLQNVDDEEEYRKFLAAVLQGGDHDLEITQENEIVDDEDEDNDADFELEIEEALESDDENAGDGTQYVDPETVYRRPTTRQIRRQKASVHHHKKLLGQLNRPLRPLLPIALSPAVEGRNVVLENSRHHLSSMSSDTFLNGFAPHQIGQLHCLIHEHVQLLIQVFSLCVLEPGKQNIASDAQGLILDLLHKRNQVLAGTRVPYPSFCFAPPFIHSSVPNELPRDGPEQCTIDPKGRCDIPVQGQVGNHEAAESLIWAPCICGPLLSILDVAPLRLVGRYMDDVSAAARDYKQRFMGTSNDSRFDKEPLFAFHSFHSPVDGSDQVLSGNIPPPTIILPPSLHYKIPRKKTMAAALVERAKKQSVALVPKEIAKLSQIFFPLFNPALLPHKPAPASVANRVLFTDAEDELLALGIMEYNTDWKAIQQRFLPCKSKHQIFVRQKNRASSKAPENPIKAVRRMKNSPLTAEERARIEEGLRVFKLDWMSVWKFVVPHRDPSLLPRQWRIATGTQKSYKSDAAKKAKRRLYESNRRKCKVAALASCKTSSEKEDNSADNVGGENNSGDDNTDKVDESCVHEAFLADWRPGFSGTNFAGSDLGSKNQFTYRPMQSSYHVREQMINCGFGDAQSQVGHEFPAVSRSQLYLRPYRARRTNNARLVKLAPDLPPVNLPPSVRVMPQSAFKSYLGGACTKVSGAGVSSSCPVKENVVPILPHALTSGVQHSVESVQSGSNPSIDFSVLGDKCPAKENEGSGLQMHPLLFKSPEDGCLPNYKLNRRSSSSANLFSGAHPQLNLSIFHRPYKASHTFNFFEKSFKSGKAIQSSFGVDFHPLLQRNGEANCNSVTGYSAPTQLSANPESLRGMYQRQKSAASGSPSSTCSKPCSPNGKTNDLDLEIHLSFTSGKDKTGGNRDVTEHKVGPASTNVENQHFKNSSDQCHDVCIADEVGGKIDSSVHPSLLSSNNVRKSNIDNIGEQSFPDIVMEQEELSDTDEESVEHVEFECEEMADSEGEEESGSEQIVNIQNKEALNVAMENIVTDAEFDSQLHKPIIEGNSEGSFGGPPDSSTNKSGFADKAKDSASHALCLNSNSHQAKPKRVVSKNVQHCSSRDQAPSRSCRSSKSIKQHMEHTTLKKHHMDTPQLLNCGSLAVNPPRRPRKRAHRTDLRTGRANKRGSTSNTEADCSNSGMHC